MKAYFIKIIHRRKRIYILYQPGKNCATALQLYEVDLSSRGKFVPYIYAEEKIFIEITFFVDLFSLHSKSFGPL